MLHRGLLNYHCYTYIYFHTLTCFNYSFLYFCFSHMQHTES